VTAGETRARLFEHKAVLAASKSRLSCGNKGRFKDLNDVFSRAMHCHNTLYSYYYYLLRLGSQDSKFTLSLLVLNAGTRTLLDTELALIRFQIPC